MIYLLVAVAYTGLTALSYWNIQRDRDRHVDHGAPMTKREEIAIAVLFGWAMPLLALVWLLVFAIGALSLVIKPPAMPSR